MMLDRNSILGVADRMTEVVEVPEWGGSVLVSVMSGVARDAWEQSLFTRTTGPDGKATGAANLKNVRARLVAMTVVDESGARLFSDEDVEALGNKSGHALERVVKVAQRLNALTEADLEAAKGN